MKRKLSPSFKSNLPIWIQGGWCITIVLVAAILGARTVEATHGSGTVHQKLVHRGATSIGYWNSADDENWCPESHTSYMLPATLGTRVEDALQNSSPRWRNVSNGLVEYARTLKACADYLDRNWIEIEYHVSKTNSENPAKLCDENLSCVQHYTSVWTGAHTDYLWQWVNLDYDNIKFDTATNRRAINHETGHVYGLLDGEGTCTPESIMHNIWYYCTYSGSTPTSGDLQGVLNIGNLP